MIAAIVLAAGLSSRMGSNKLLVEIDGHPMVARTVEAVLGSRARPVIVVTGNDAERVEAALAGRPVRTVRNPDPALGLSASLRVGLRALPDTVEGALVCLGDMPFVRPADLDALIDAFDPERADICVPTRGGRRGNPVLWGRRHFAEICALSGDRGARALLETHAARVRAVAMSDDGVLRDIDTPADLNGA